LNVSVRLFATLRQKAGWKERTLSLDDGATVRDLISLLDAGPEGLELGKRTIYIAINEEYAKADHPLNEGDLVGIFPPVSGGAESNEAPAASEGGATVRFYEITEAPLSLDDAMRRVSRPDCGAVATFAGIVRGETVTDGGLRGTDYLHYEAYTQMAERKMAQIGDEMRARWPKVQAVAILHRTGRLEIGEPSVIIAVSTPHRGDGCFDACAYAIERLKQIVPIWKQENWADGQQWIEGPRQPDLEA
jgi:molybdopterin synthase catalytic subunit